MTTINYSVDYYNPSPIRFTETGHVDMDYFDEDPAAENETYMLAIFYDEEVEELCRPILDAHEATLTEQSKEEWSYVNINRHEVKPEKKERINYGPEFFWNTFLDLGNGFNPDDFGWDETDINDKPYDWNTDQLFKQVPKQKDFIKVCQHEIANEMVWATKDLTDIGVDEAESIVMEKMIWFLSMSRQMYQQDFDREWMMMRGML